MSILNIKRGAANKIADEPVVDGALLLDKESGALYADVGNKRLEVGAIAKNDAVFESNATFKRNATFEKDATFDKNVTIYGNTDVKGTVVATSIVAKSDAELGNTSCTSLTANSATCKNLTVSESMTINAPYVAANRIEGTSVSLPSEDGFLVNETSFKSLLLDAVYPIGSLYWSRYGTDPATLFGGTWKRIKDRFILAAGDTYASGSRDGEASVTLTIDQMPVHTHGLPTNLINGSSATQPLQTAGGADYGMGIGAKYYTDETGGGQAHNNMPPYDTFYCWERIDPSTETGNEQ